MDILFIFAIGWVMSHAFSEKRDEYSAAQEGHREKYLAKLKNDHPSWGRARQERYLHNAARRNALGHFAYLLRHGWSSTFNDFGDGWKKAKGAHEEWRNEHPKGSKKPGAWATFKAGWKDRWAKRPQSTGYYEPRPELTPEPDPPKGKPTTDTTGQTDEPAKTEPWLTDDAARDAKVYPWPTNNTNTPQPSPEQAAATPNTNGGPMSGETGGYVGAHNLTDRYTAQMVTAQSTLEQYQAELISDAKLGGDQRVMQTLAAAQEALAQAMAAFGAHKTALSGHQEGHEYATSKGAAAADTRWLGQG